LLLSGWPVTFFVVIDLHTNNLVSLHMQMKFSFFCFGI